jgi:subtilisin
VTMARKATKRAKPRPEAARPAELPVLPVGQTSDDLPIPGMPPGPLPPIPKDPIVLSGIVPASPRTGRRLLLLPADGGADGRALVSAAAGYKIVDSSEAGPDILSRPLDDRQAVEFRSLGVILCSGEDPERAARLDKMAGGRSAVQALEEERYLFHAGMDASWVRGYRAAIEDLSNHLLRAPEAPPEELSDLVNAARRGIGNASWSIRAVLAADSRFAGRGVKLAVLDTGVDAKHADLSNRIAAGRGFTGASPADFADGNGHGTHCAGVAAGPRRPSGTGTRYGVAGEALLHVGKVLDDRGQGVDANILAGIEWAITQGCRVISMSLGAPVGLGEPPSQIYKHVALRARAHNAIIIAAAGNDSDRPNSLAPVSHPANCDSIMAVAALDRSFRVARFSNAGLNNGGGVVDIAAPGVGVYSAWPGARRYRQESGTSMATPHVAGIAAMLIEAQPQLTADALFREVCRLARPLPGASGRDVGAGLAQAPR